jgi:hypothetical protein
VSLPLKHGELQSTILMIALWINWEARSYPPLSTRSFLPKPLRYSIDRKKTSLLNLYPTRQITIAMATKNCPLVMCDTQTAAKIYTKHLQAYIIVYVHTSYRGVSFVIIRDNAANHNP